MSTESQRTCEVLCVCEPIAAGVPVYVAQIIKRLEGDGFHFTVACPAESILCRTLEGTAAAVLSVDMRRGLHIWSDTRAFLQLNRIMRARNFDLVHLHSSKAGLLGRPLAYLRSLPVAFTPHCFSFESARDNPVKYRSYLLAERLLGFLTDKLVCVAVPERELALEHRIVTRQTQVALVQCFADMEFWAPRSASDRVKQRLGIPAGNKVVGSVSRLFPQKAPLDFARMAEALVKVRSDVTFVFVGQHGPLYAEFMQCLKDKELTDRVIFHSYVNDPCELRELVACFDVFVLNSLWEGAPIAIVEAMAMAKPIVATAVPGICAMVGDPPCGLLSPVAEPESMARQIVKLLDDPDLARTSGANGRQKAIEEYSISRAVQLHRDLYRTLASD